MATVGVLCEHFSLILQLILEMCEHLHSAWRTLLEKLI